MIPLSIRPSRVLVGLGNGTHCCEITRVIAGTLRIVKVVGSNKTTPNWSNSFVVTSVESQLAKGPGPPNGSPGTPEASSTNRGFVTSKLQPKRSSPRVLSGSTRNVAAAVLTFCWVIAMLPNVPVGVAGAPEDTGPLGSNTTMAVRFPESLSTKPKDRGSIGKDPPPALASPKASNCRAIGAINKSAIGLVLDIRILISVALWLVPVHLGPITATRPGWSRTETLRRSHHGAGRSPSSRTA